MPVTLMRRVALAALTALVLAVGVVSGCGGGGQAPPRGTAIAIVTPGGRDDADWTAVTVAVVKRAAARHHLRAIVVDGSAGDVDAALRRVAANARLIVVPYPRDRAAAVRATASTDVPTLVWGDPRAQHPGRVADVEWDGPEGAYAAGTMAVHAATYRSVGIVMCGDAEPLEMARRYRMAAAFVAGARAEDPRVRVFYARAGTDGRPVLDRQAKAATLRITVGGPTIRVAGLAEPGAEFVFGLCGRAIGGVMGGVVKAAAEHQLVSLVGDKHTINRHNALLTSILVHPEIAIDEALDDLASGSFGRRTYALDFANHGISLLSTGRTPADAYEAALDRRDAVVGRQVTLPDVSGEAALRAYIGVRSTREAHTATPRD